MSSTTRLAGQAVELATARGHLLGPWTWRYHQGMARCEHCELSAFIVAGPAAGEEPIMGGAITKDCRDGGAVLQVPAPVTPPSDGATVAPVRALARKLVSGPLVRIPEPSPAPVAVAR